MSSQPTPPYLAEQILRARLSLLATGWLDIISKNKDFQTTNKKTLNILDGGILRLSELDPKISKTSKQSAYLLFRDAHIKLDNKQIKGVLQLSWAPMAKPVGTKIILRVCYLPPARSVAAPLLSLQNLLAERLHWAENPATAPIHKLPGLCGIAASNHPEELDNLIQHAAEARAYLKADNLIRPLKQHISNPNDPRVQHQLEQKLFEGICRFIGSKSYQEPFSALAKHFPLSQIKDTLQLKPERAKLKILSLWMGALHMLKEPLADIHPDCRAYYSQLKNNWEKHDAPSPLVPLQKTRTRPLNSLERRLIALFWHIYHLQPHGLLNGWLGLLSQIDPLRNDETMQSEVKNILRKAFHTPHNEPWQLHTTFHSKMLPQPVQLAGDHLVAVLAANAIVPFFLGLARWKKDTEMEKTLYRFYLLLPTEISNPRIQYMEERLFLSSHKKRPLRSQQGILQLHQDFCHHFPYKCQLCKIPILRTQHTFIACHADNIDDGFLNKLFQPQTHSVHED